MEPAMGAAGLAAAPHPNASRPAGPRPEEAPEARGGAEALDAGQADGRLRECGPGAVGVVRDWELGFVPRGWVCKLSALLKADLPSCGRGSAFCSS